MTSQIFGYDLTIDKRSGDQAKIKKWFESIAKKWVFQEELGKKTAYSHYQCRISLKIRKRLTEFGKMMSREELKGDISCTANNTKDFDYVIKSDTRVAGPWCDKDTESEIIIPADIDHITVETLRPYQKNIYDTCVAQRERKTMTFRSVDFIYDPNGCIGKTVLTRFLVWNKLAMYVPVMQDAQDIMQWVMSFPPSPGYIIDMPRSQSKDRLAGFWSGIEQLRSGFASDKRNKGRFRMQTPPVVWVFSNTQPDLAALSEDRWNIWFVDHKMKLVRFTEARIAKMKIIWAAESATKKLTAKAIDIWEDEPIENGAIAAPKITEKKYAVSDSTVDEFLAGLL